MPYIFLNPDGKVSLGLLVIVEHSTGVKYAQQCGGTAAEVKTCEGYLIPVGGPADAKRIYHWFWKRFGGKCSTGKVEWKDEWITQLGELVRAIPCWQTRANGDDVREFLELDVNRIEECVEAWIPVRTPYGAGILTLDNSS